MKLPKYLTTITTFSKILAMTLFILLPILGFKLGMDYQNKLNILIAPSPIIPTPTASYLVPPILNDIKDPNEDKIMAQYLTKAQISADLDKNLLLGSYIEISNTDLQIKIPATYVLQERERESNNVVGHVLFYGKETSLSSTNPIIQRLPNFFIGTVLTSSTPKQWLSENVSYQGQKWDESIEPGREININGFNIFSVGVACCGGYNQLYIYQHKLLNGKGALIIFGSYDVFADNDYDTENWTKGTDTNQNIILDKVVSTLQRK